MKLKITWKYVWYENQVVRMCFINGYPYTFEDLSTEPYTVTPIIEPKIKIIPIDCWKEGDSDNKIIPQTIVKTGCNKIANEVYAAGNLGKE